MQPRRLLPVGQLHDPDVCEELSCVLDDIYEKLPYLSDAVRKQVVASMRESRR